MNAEAIVTILMVVSGAIGYAMGRGFKHADESTSEPDEQ